MSKKFLKSISAILSMLIISGTDIPTYAYTMPPNIVREGINREGVLPFLKKKIIVPHGFIDRVRNFEYFIQTSAFFNSMNPNTFLEIAAWERTYDSFASDAKDLIKKIKNMIILKVTQKNKDGIEEEKFVPLNESSTCTCNCHIDCTGSVATLKFNEGLRIDPNNIILLDKNCQDENFKGKSDLEKVNFSGRDYYIDAKNKLVFSVTRAGLITVADARIYAAMALDSKSTPEELSFADTVKEKCKIPYAIESKQKIKNFFCKKIPSYFNGFHGINSGVRWFSTRHLYDLNNKGISLKELGGEERTVSLYFDSHDNLKIRGVFTSDEVEFNFDENLWKENDVCTKNGEKKKVYVNEKDGFIVSVPYDKKIDVSKENCDVEVWALVYAKENKCIPNEFFSR